MRPILALLLLLACAPLIALAATPGAPPSAANLVRWRPAPWRMPAPAAAAMRFDPETGEAVASPSSRAMSAMATSRAEARRLAATSVRTSADGSRHAILGPGFGMWMVATIDDRGRLTQDCVSSQHAAEARVDAAAKPQVRK
jgi:hypothetical protein